MYPRFLISQVIAFEIGAQALLSEVEVITDAGIQQTVTISRGFQRSHLVLFAVTGPAQIGTDRFTLPGQLRAEPQRRGAR